jgi:hypothetical protein
MSLAFRFLREFLEMLGGLKKLLACLINRDPLDNGSNLLCLPAVFGSFGEALDGHALPLHVGRNQPSPFDLD